MPMPAGAFALAPVPTPAALVAQAQGNAALQSRWGRALGLEPNADIVSYFRSLHVGPLAKSHVYRVYYARLDGTWGYKIRLVPQNTPVFVNAAGTPLLLQVCANPIRELTHAQQTAQQQPPKLWSANETDEGMILEGSTSDSGAALTSSGNLDSTGTYFGIDASAGAGVGTVSGGSFAASGGSLIDSATSKLIGTATSALKAGSRSSSGAKTSDSNSSTTPKPPSRTSDPSSGSSGGSSNGSNGSGGSSTILLGGGGNGSGNGTGSGAGPSPVPEPGFPVFGLCAIGVLGAALWNGRRKKAIDIAATAV